MLNKRIHELRLSFGWSQTELARRLGVSKQAVSNWENDNIQPSVDVLIRLADAFGVTTDYLLGREDIPRIAVPRLSPSAAAHLALLLQDLQTTIQKQENPD